MQPNQLFKFLLIEVVGKVNYLLSPPVNENIMDWRIERMILKNIAVRKPSTAKPPTILVHRSIISALMTSRNSPNVIIVTGKVSNTKIGFIKILSNPKTMATMTEVVKLATLTPGIKWAMTITRNAVTRILMIRFINFYFKF